MCFLRIAASHCVLCDARAKNTSLCLCNGCLNDLPRIKDSCWQCGKIFSSSSLNLCGGCQTHGSNIDRTFSLFHYKAPVDYLIKRLKFHHSFLVADLLGKLLSQQIIQQDIELPEALVPIPLHYKRLRERGYNQALELAKPLSKQLDIPLLREGLIRDRHTRPQTECRVKERRRNLRNSFRCLETLPYRAVALVDDVITTGTTINEAAKVLKQNGVKVVYAWSAAHT